MRQDPPAGSIEKDARTVAIARNGEAVQRRRLGESVADIDTKSSHKAEDVDRLASRQSKLLTQETGRRFTLNVRHGAREPLGNALRTILGQLAQTGSIVLFELTCQRDDFPDLIRRKCARHAGRDS